MFAKNEYSRLRDAPIAESEGRDEHYYRHSPRNWQRIAHIFSYSILVIANVIFVSIIYQQTQASSECVRPQLTFSGPKSAGAITYTRQHLFRRLEDNPFTGKPRPELDAAYGKLLKPMTVRITPQEYQQANLGVSTLKLKDGSGYIGEMAVYHELHCIKRLRRHLALDYYYPHLTGDELERENIHAGMYHTTETSSIAEPDCSPPLTPSIATDHCLEYLRESIVCRGDTTFTPMFWRDGLPTSRVDSIHECVDWDRLDSYARSRMVDMSDPSILDEEGRWDLISFPNGSTALRDPSEVRANRSL